MSQATPGARAFVELDQLTGLLGCELEHASEDEAVLSLLVTAELSNAHGTCHGGVLFSLADIAFGALCNAGTSPAVAAAAAIEFLEPVQVGEVVRARAVTVARRGRTRICDITLTVGEVVVATFRGRASDLPARTTIV